MKNNKLVVLEFVILSLFLFSCSKQKLTQEINNPTLDSSYIYFGQWPQSIKSDDVVIDNSLVNYNGWDCYKGSDNNYYVKETAINKSGNALKFSDGSLIEDGREYYFLVEGIKWKILSSDKDTKLLLSDNILTSFYFNKDKSRKLNDKTILPNNYGHSDIRCYLNGLDGSSYGSGNYDGIGFLDKAFSDEEKISIKRTIIDNSQESCNANNEYKKEINRFICKDTNDKVFLFSLNEITNPDYDFSDYEIDRTKSNKNRRRKITDYSKALGLPFSSFNETTSYYLRTPDSFSSNSVELVNQMGLVNAKSSLVTNYAGIVPAIFVSNWPIENQEIDESNADYVIEDIEEKEVPILDLETQVSKEFKLLFDNNIAIGLYDNVTNIENFHEEDYLIINQWGDIKLCEQIFNDVAVTWNSSNNLVIKISTSSPYCSTVRGIRIGDNVSKIKEMYEKDSSIHVFNKDENIYEKSFSNNNGIFDMFMNDDEISITAMNTKAEEIMHIKYSLDNDKIKKIEFFSY